MSSALDRLSRSGLGMGPSHLLTNLGLDIWTIWTRIDKAGTLLKEDSDGQVTRDHAEMHNTLPVDEPHTKPRAISSNPGPPNQL